MEGLTATIKDLPIPPSVNAAYGTDFRTRRRFKTKDYTTFEGAIKHWCLINPRQLGLARDLTIRIQKGHALQVDLYFSFPKEKILTKPTKQKPSHPKRNDTSNRIKIAHDALAEVLGIDDCYFWQGKFHKKALNTDHPGFMDVVLTIIKIDGY